MRAMNRTKGLQRRFLLAVVAMLAATLHVGPAWAGPSESNGDRLVLLGTAGGPSIKAARAQPANALIVDGSVYIIDAGDGVARQMALAGIPAKALRAVFITHNHSDHVADYGTLLLRAWLSGLKQPVDTYGPPPLVEMTHDYLDYMAWDIQLRIKDEGRVPLADLVRPHNIFPAGEGVIYKDGNVIVTAVQVPHGDARPSYAYRFDSDYCSVVFSGDTSRSDSLVALAQGADILVHETLSVAGVRAIVNKIDPGNEALVQHIMEAHTPTEIVGKVAAAADVDTLVLSHFVPTGLAPFDTPKAWREAAGKHYDGRIIVGEDLMTIGLDACGDEQA